MAGLRIKRTLRSNDWTALEKFEAESGETLVPFSHVIILANASLNQCVEKHQSSGLEKAGRGGKSRTFMPCVHRVDRLATSPRLSISYEVREAAGSRRDTVKCTARAGPLLA